MELSEIPGRAFLDTSVVNFILEFGDQIHDGAPNPEGLNTYQIEDIDALHNIFLTGRRADWQLAISPFTYYEIAHTSDPNKRMGLSRWFLEVWDHWIGIVENDDGFPTLIEAEKLRRTLLTSNDFDELPDIHDRILLVDALVYRCDCFCTRDWNTMLRKRDRLIGVGMPVLRPSEWWGKIRPFAGLWA
jgi:hypothetical protein